MNMRLLSQLIALAAIWSSSFIFMRVLAPLLGPLATADIRVLIAGTVLVLYFYITDFDSEWRKYWKQFLLIGALNSALPFSLFSYAALHLPASYEVILNASSPLFGAIFSALWLGEQLTRSRFVGLLVGAGGVAMVANVGAAIVDSQFRISVLACLAAAACYGLAGVYIKKFAKGAKPKAIAAHSQLCAGLLLLPGLPLSPWRAELNLFVVANILGLALLCSAVAYLLYFNLMEEAGPTKALSVTFLMPLFGMLWGKIFLAETITRSMVSGCFLILAGTGMLLYGARFSCCSKIKPSRGRPAMAKTEA